MEFLKDRRVALVLIGAAVALLAGAVIAWVLSRGQGGEGAPPASQSGLVIDSAGAEEGKLDAARPLRCFVAGQFVGELTLAECANRNGVATGALDVGLDETGALAAAQQAGAMLAPLPPPSEDVAPAEPREPAAGAEASQPVAAPLGACLRYIDGEWRRLPSDLTLNACVEALFAGRCERPGRASYGRWMQQTLRLAPGRVEISADNHSFRPLAEQSANCVIAPIP